MDREQVVIVDGDDVSRNGMAIILHKAEIPVKVVAAFASMEASLHFLEAQPVKILLLTDTAFDQTDIMKWVIYLHKQYEFMAIVVVSEHLGAGYINMLFKYGISGFIYRKDRFTVRLANAVNAVLGGDVYLSPRASEKVLLARASLKSPMLSRRDIEVLRLMQDGYTVKEIATQLHVSDQAVYRCRRKLRESLQVQTSEQIITAAIQKGLI